MSTTQQSQASSPPPIDIEKDELLGCAAVAKLMVADGQPLSPTSVWRLMTRGRRGIRLPAVRIGRKLCTTRAAVDWFVRVTVPVEGSEADESEEPASQSAQTKQQAERATAACAAAGW